MLQQFLSFDKLIGTKLIKILYYLGLVGIALGGIGALFGAIASMRYGFIEGLGALVVAIIGIILSLVFWRFMCEIYMLFFRMSDDLRDIKNEKLGREHNTTDVL